MPEEDLSVLKIEKIHFRKKRLRKSFIYLLAILMIPLFIYLFLLNREREVEVSSVTIFYPARSYTLLNASGYVVASRKAAVASKITGRLIEVNVEEGSFVRKGDIIARLEYDDALAMVEEARANLELSLSSLDIANHELHNAEMDFKRDKELYEKGYISRAEYDASEMRYKKAIAQVRLARAQVDMARASLRNAEINLEYTYIRAPFDGVILTKTADKGDVITPFGSALEAKAAVFTMADLRSLEIDVDVSEQNIRSIKKGQPCLIELDAFPEKVFKGSVSRIIPTAERTKGTVPVKVRFVEYPQGLLPDMSARISFLSKEIEAKDLTPVIVVDKRAILRRDNRDFVYVVQKDRVREVEVRKGVIFDNTHVEIIQGLEPGWKVVLNPEGLRDNSFIRIKD